MDAEIKRIVDSSNWIRLKIADNLQLGRCKMQHEIFERIFLNVSAYYGVKYRDVMKAQSIDGELYAYLCICILLIDEYLFKVFNLNEIEREKLLQEWFNVLVDYYNSK